VEKSNKFSSNLEAEPAAKFSPSYHNHVMMLLLLLLTCEISLKSSSSSRSHDRSGSTWRLAFVDFEVDLQIHLAAVLLLF